MKAIIIILLLALIPSLLSPILIRKAKQRFRARMRGIRSMSPPPYRMPLPGNVSNPALEPPEPYRDFLGDVTCEFNARSPYLRCAVNPSGPCEGCSYYKAK